MGTNPGGVVGIYSERRVSPGYTWQNIQTHINVSIKHKVIVNLCSFFDGAFNLMYKVYFSAQF